VARKERKGAAEERLEGFLAAGDWRSAKGEARKLAGSSEDGERAAGERALVRLRPGPTAILAFAAGLAFLAAIAAAGLRMR
jgi:DNA-binding LacI/PurR family transcriptional regulator